MPNESSRAVAKVFLQSLGVIEEPVYRLTTYNVTKNAEIGDLYSTSRFGVKVVGHKVEELYGVDAIYGNTRFPYVSYDVVTLEIADTYLWGPDLTLVKNNEVVTHFVAPGAALPKSIANKVRDLPFKDAIRCWSEKPYGLIVEYYDPARATV